MINFQLLNRISSYHQRHGLKASLQRAFVWAKRLLFDNKMIIFYVDLKNLPMFSLPGGILVKTIADASSLNENDRAKILSYWNPEIKAQQIEERFSKDAQLWTVYMNDNLAGFGWTLRGKTIEPYFFPLTENDAHLFDFQIFESCRGRAINPALVKYMLNSLTKEGVLRAFIETHEWNTSEIHSLLKTPFRKVGVARKFKLSNKSLVSWEN